MPSGAVIASSSQAEVNEEANKTANVTIQSSEADRKTTGNFKRMKNGGGIFGSPQNTDEKVWNLHYVYTNPRIGGESQTTSIRLTQKGNASTLQVSNKKPPMILPTNSSAGQSTIRPST